MKKIHMIAALLALLLPTMVWGGTTYYAKLNVGIASSSPTGSGTVYAAKTSTATSGSASATDNGDGTSFTLYAFSKANYGYKLKGWATDQSGNSIVSDSNKNPFPVLIDASNNTSSSSPKTENRYAVFEEKTNYAVSIAVPAVSGGFASYSVTGNNGYTAKTFSSAESLKAYYDETYTFTCALKNSDVYEFDGWEVNGTKETSDPTLTKTFLAAATVRAIIKEKDHYAVTLAAPELSAGFSSYTVSGPGVSGAGLASGGSLTAYYDGTYSFTCNLSDSSVYEFVKWTITDSSGTTESTANPLSKQFTDNATVKAVLNMKEQYRLTLTKPTGVTSYTVTGPTGADSLSNGGTLDFFGTADFTFNCAIDDNYKFLNWSVTDDDGTSAPTTRTLQKRVSSNTSVAAVVAPKETYSLTLEKPEGVTSYTVTATPGGAMGSLSAGGTATVREQDSYRFECAINDVEYVFDKWLVTGANGSTIADSKDRVFTTTFSSAATVTAVLYKKGVYELTFVKPDEVSEFTVTGPNGPVSISEEGKATVYERDEYQITCAFDEDNWEIVNWTVSDSSGESTVSTLNNKTFTSDATVIVTLAKIEAFIATCHAVPSGCSYKVRGGTTTSYEAVTTADKKVKGTKGQPLTVTLSAATAGSGYLFAGWYVENADGSRTYISKDSSVTQTFNSHVKLGADFVSSSSSKTALVMKKDGGYGEYDDLSDAFDNLEAGDSMYIYSNATIDQGTTNVVYKGTTLTLSAGVTLTVNGALAVAGTVAGSGTITGSGTLLKISYLIDQGDVITPKTADGAECDSIIDSTYFKVKPKYRRTTVTANNPNISGTIGCTQSWGVLLNGTRSYGISKKNPTALQVTMNTSSAVNEISSIKGTVDSITSTANYLLLANCSLTGPKSDKTSRLNFQGTVDCAGKTLTVSGAAYDSNFYSYYLNGTVNFTGSRTYYFQGGKAAVFNCSSVSVPYCKNGSNLFYFYDCGSEDSPCSLTFTYYHNSSRDDPNLADTTNYRIANFYSGCYNYTFDSTNDGNSHCNVYGGAYTSDPSTCDCVPDTYNNVALEVLPPNTTNNQSQYYLVQRKGGNVGEKVVEISGKGKYETLQAAVDAASNGDTLLLLTIVDLNGSTVTVDKSVTISLESHTILGGKIVNNGTLLLTDEITGAIDKVTNIGKGVITSDIENNGILDIVFGTYKGTIVNKAGTLTTHNGLFNGSVGKEGGSVVIKGGHFSKTAFTKETLTELGIAENCEIVVARENGSAVNWYSVCEPPNGTMVANGTSGYQITPYSLSNPDDFHLILKRVKNNYASRTDYSETEWNRLAELLAFYQAFNPHVIDATLLVDREVRGSTLEFNGKVGGYSYPITLQTLAANSTNRLLSAAMVKAGWTAMAYKYFFTHERGPFQTIGYTATSSSSDNNGTVCLVWIELWDSTRAKDYTSSNPHMNTNSLFVVGQKLFTLGAGSNKAMIRPATGAADFYSTLQGAIDVVENNGGGTVMLANNCTEKPHFATVGTYIVDSMGFEHSFSGAEGGYTVAEGLSVTAEPVTSSVTALIPSAVAIKYVVTVPPHPADYVVIPSEHLTEWKSDNGITGSTESEIREALKQEDANGIAKWENVVMGQEGTHKPAIETSTNGTETVADMVLSFKVPENTGYTVKYAFDKVDDAGSVVESGTAEANPQLDLTQVSTAGTPAYFKMRAVLVSNDESHTFTAEVPVEHTVGVLKVDSSATNTILAVPWKSFHNTDVNVAELVHAASLSEDDMLQAYDGDGNVKSWYVKNGVWTSATDVSVSGEQQTVGEKVDPVTFGIARGKGVWLKRYDTSKPIYLMGMPTTEAATTTLTPAESSSKPSWNLLASPKLEAVNFGKFNTGDEIIVPTAGTPKHYTYKNNAWGYPGATVTSTTKLPNGQTIQVISVEHKTDDTTITPGTGFWYLNKGGEKTIGW